MNNNKTHDFRRPYFDAHDYVCCLFEYKIVTELSETRFAFIWKKTSTVFASINDVASQNNYI